MRSALIPMLVAKDQLFGAIALNAIAITLSMILGPVLAKVVGDQFGFEGAFWFQAILMFVGVLFLLRLEVPPHEEVRERRSVLDETRTALRHVLDDPHLKTLFGLLLTASLTINPAIMVTIQAHVKDELGQDAGQAALPFALMGLGIAITSFVVMRKGDMKNKGAIFQRAMMCGTAITFLTGRTTDVLAGARAGVPDGPGRRVLHQHEPGPRAGQHAAGADGPGDGPVHAGQHRADALRRAGHRHRSRRRSAPAMRSALAAAIGFAVVLTTYVRNAELRRLGLTCVIERYEMRASRSADQVA